MAQVLNFKARVIILTRTKAICSSRVAVQKARGSAAAVGSSRYKRGRHCLGVGAWRQPWLPRDTRVRTEQLWYQQKKACLALCRDVSLVLGSATWLRLTRGAGDDSGSVADSGRWHISCNIHQRQMTQKRKARRSAVLLEADAAKQRSKPSPTVFK